MAEIPEAPRIRRTTRDPEELTRRLASWLAAVHPGARPAAVTVPDSNGMSSETLLFDIEQEGAAAPPPSATASCAWRRTRTRTPSSPPTT